MYSFVVSLRMFYFQDCLYHHPVHKISFIAQDMSDNRAFGYVYGSPENGHRFFGIKTEKAAGQVVVAMRDLFQVVFEMKKKEIDEAKQNMDSDLINVSTKIIKSLLNYVRQINRNIDIDKMKMNLWFLLIKITYQGFFQDCSNIP